MSGSEHHGEDGHRSKKRSKSSDGTPRKEKQEHKEKKRERKRLKAENAAQLPAAAPAEEAEGTASGAAAAEATGVVAAGQLEQHEPQQQAGHEAAAEPQAAAGSHDADAAAAQQEQTGPAVAGGSKAAAPTAVAAATAKAAKPGKAAPVLPWMRVPIAIEASEGILLEEVKGLDPRLKLALEGSGIEVLFPVQTVVWHQTAGGSSLAHDMCICAPTGSGKTLSYALPVLQGLSGRAVPCLRALAVLPTRDLALQVFNVLSTLCPALGLTACLACGKASLAAEAELLAAGGIDILVATPGRLIAHLEGTPGFTLRHLRFLVVDETDRLLRQSYQDWLPKVMAALQHPAAAADAGDGSSSRSSGGGGGALPTGGSSNAAAAAAVTAEPSAPLLLGEQQQRRVVKFVVSATLTRDPSKIDRLGLHCPRYIAMSAVDHRYKLPRSLRELKLVVPAERKPAALAALLQELRGEQTIVFTSSVEATHRLYLLLAALSCLPDRVVEYSSLVRPEERGERLEAFRSGAAKVLVCSDAMTRGMDVVGVENVVNYDAPVYVKTYVHRAGRTARAGRSGRVFTLLRHEDVRHFKDMLRKADNTFVKDHRLGKGALEGVRDDADEALEAMGQQLQAEGGQQQQQQQQQRGVSAAVAPAVVALAAEAGSAPTPLPAAGQQEQRSGSSKAAKRRKVPGVPEFCL